MGIRCWRGLTVVCGFLIPTFPIQGDEVPNLLRLAPEGANTIAVLRVHDLTGSPRGIDQGWAAKHEQAFLNGAITVPPQVESLVRLSNFRPGMTGGEWTAVLVPLPNEVAMAALAKREGTEPQELKGHEIVYSRRRNGYFVELENPNNGSQGVLGGLSPATRQDVAHWLDDLQDSSGSALSSFLKEAASDATAQLVMAVDLQDMLDPAQIRYRLAGAQALQDQPQARTALTIDLQSLHGIRLAVRVTDTATAEIRFDFKRSIGDEGQFLKPLMIEYLQDIGAMLDELDQATVQTAGNSVTLTMPFSDESLRRILSMVTAPPSPTTAQAQQSLASSSPSPKPDSPEIQNGVDVKASLKYFQAVNHNLDDLQKAYRRSKNYAQTAHWHENFAQRIRSLPTAGVDSDLVKYGENVASLLNALAESLRGTGVQVEMAESTGYYRVKTTPRYYSGADWWWGGAWTVNGPYTYGRPVDVQVDTNLQEVRAKQAEFVQAGNEDRAQIWQQVDALRSAITRLMVSRYGSEFQDQRR